MPAALEPRERLFLDHEALVVLVFQFLVPLEKVERAVVVLRVVGALASAADGVEHLEFPQLVVAQVVEQKLGAEVPVAVAEVLQTYYVLVLDAPRILGVSVIIF